MGRAQRRAAGDVTLPKAAEPRQPPVWRELARGCVRQTFTHQFALLAFPRGRVNPSRGSPAPVWNYRRRFAPYIPGLARVKHEQRLEARARDVAAFRLAAAIKGNRVAIHENPELGDPKNRDQMRREGRAAYANKMRKRQKTIAERYAEALADGQGDLFIKTLDH